MNAYEKMIFDKTYCPNSMSGKHKQVEQRDKNKGKNVCMYCYKFLDSFNGIGG